MVKIPIFSNFLACTYHHKFHHVEKKKRKKRPILRDNTHTVLAASERARNVKVQLVPCGRPPESLHTEQPRHTKQVPRTPGNLQSVAPLPTGALKKKHHEDSCGRKANKRKESEPAANRHQVFPIPSVILIVLDSFPAAWFLRLPKGTESRRFLFILDKIQPIEKAQCRRSSPRWQR